MRIRINRILITLLLVTVGSELSCSYMTDFFIANVCGEKVTVTLKLDDRFCPKNTIPSDIVPVPSFKLYSTTDDPDNWKELHVVEYTFDHDNCSVEFELPDKTAVKIGRSGCYTRPSMREYNFFDVKGVTLVSDTGSTEYKGYDTLKAFKKIDTYTYILEYN